MGEVDRPRREPVDPVAHAEALGERAGVAAADLPGGVVDELAGGLRPEEITEVPRLKNCFKFRLGMKWRNG